MTKNARSHNIHAKIASEGYCCVWGFLNLCKARGQTPSTMMPFLGLSRLTFYHHNRKLKNGLYSCEGKPDCLKDAIAEIRNSLQQSSGEIRPSDSNLGGPEGKPNSPGTLGEAPDSEV